MEKRGPEQVLIYLLAVLFAMYLLLTMTRMLEKKAREVQYVRVVSTRAFGNSDHVGVDFFSSRSLSLAIPIRVPRFNALKR
jgi:hypothetical protein